MRNVKTQLIIRLIGATMGAMGFYFSALSRPIIGGTLIGLGTILLAIGGGFQ